MRIINESNLKIKKDIPYFQIEELNTLGWVKHAFLTRKGGISPFPYNSLNFSKNNGDCIENISYNRKLIADMFDFKPQQLVLLNQIHKDNILIVNDHMDLEKSSLEYDAIITNIPNLYFGILTADCIPIFIVDQKKKVIGAIHAGRQGTALKITKKVLKEIKKRFNSSSNDFIISLGPSIGPCCYEIDEKIYLKEWESFSKQKGDKKWMIDIAKINIQHMKEEGVMEDQIIKIDLCTSCRKDLFFSYRKESKTGRQLSFIGINQKGH